MHKCMNDEDGSILNIFNKTTGYAKIWCLTRFLCCDYQYIIYFVLFLKSSLISKVLLLQNIFIT